jgi:iron(III) transport system permease protein
MKVNSSRIQFQPDIFRLSCDMLVWLILGLFLIFPLFRLLLDASLFESMQLLIQSDETRSLLWITLSTAALTTTIATILALFTTYILAGFSFTGRSFILSLLPLTFLLPPFVGGIAFRRLLSRFGPINLILMKLGIITEPIEFLSSGGIYAICLAQALHLYPLIVLSLLASLEKFDRSTIEAAIISQSSKLKIFTRILYPLLFPLVLPAVILVWIAAFTDLGTPLLFGFHRTLPVYIFDLSGELHTNPLAKGAAVLLLGMTVLISLGAYQISRKLPRSFIAGRTSQPLQLETQSKKEKPFFIFGIWFVILLSFLPHLTLALLSLTEVWGTTVIPKELTFEHYKSLFQHPLVLHSSGRTIFYAVGCTLIDTILALIILLPRDRSASHNSLLRFFTLSPLLLPGVIVAFSYLLFFDGTFLDPKFSPIALLIFGYSIRRLPFFVQFLEGGVKNSDVMLYEAAKITGASEKRILQKITLPLLKPFLLRAALLTFLFSFLEVSESLLLALKEEDYPITKALYAITGRPDGVGVGSALGFTLLVVLSAISIFATRKKGLFVRILFASSFLFSTATAIAQNNQSLKIISPHWEGYRYEAEEAFRKYSCKGEGTKSCPKIEWINVGGTADIQRYIISEYSKHPNEIGIDLLFGGGIETFQFLHENGLLKKIPTESFRGIPETENQILIRNEEETFTAVSLSTFGILCNKEVLDLLHKPLPTTWSDLAAPEMKNIISFGNPKTSGAMHMITEIILQSEGWNEGWKILFGIKRNVSSIGNHANDVIQELNSGETGCGVTIDSYAREQQRRFSKEAFPFILPANKTLYTGDGVGILKGTKNSQNAALFIQMLLSKEFQTKLMKPKGTENGPTKFDLNRLSIRKDLYSATDKTNPFTFVSNFSYSPTKSFIRWDILNDLFSVFLLGSTKLSDDNVLLVPSEDTVTIQAKTNLSQLQREEWRESIRKSLPNKTGEWFETPWTGGLFFVVIFLLARATRR